MTQPSKPRPRAVRTPASVRLFPAVMATGAAIIGLKAFGVAESLAQAAAAEPAAQTEAAAAPPAAGAGATTAAAQTAQAQSASTTQCTPTVAQLAGLSQSEVEVLQALSARRQSLDQRATQMETQGDVVLAAERRLDQRLAQLHQLETTVNGLLGQLDQVQQQRLANLVDVYQRMRAKDAATVFDGLDDGVMVQVASRMRQDNLAAILGRMQPDRARRLTQMLADAARPPTDGQQLLSRADGTTPAGASAGQAGQR